MVTFKFTVTGMFSIVLFLLVTFVASNPIRPDNYRSPGRHVPDGHVVRAQAGWVQTVDFPVATQYPTATLDDSHSSRVTGAPANALTTLGRRQVREQWVDEFGRLNGVFWPAETAKITLNQHYRMTVYNEKTYYYTDMDLFKDKYWTPAHIQTSHRTTTSSIAPIATSELQGLDHAQTKENRYNGELPAETAKMTPGQMYRSVVKEGPTTYYYTGINAFKDKTWKPLTTFEDFATGQISQVNAPKTAIDLLRLSDFITATTVVPTCETSRPMANGNKHTSFITRIGIASALPSNMAIVDKGDLPFFDRPEPRIGNDKANGEVIADVVDI